MTTASDIISRASLIAADYGEDVGEALARFEDAGGQRGGADATTWVSVAFLFGRRWRDRLLGTAAA